VLAWRAAEAFFPGDRSVGRSAVLLALYARSVSGACRARTWVITCAVFAAPVGGAPTAGCSWPLATWIALALGVVVRLDTALVCVAFLAAVGVAGPRRARALAQGGGVLAAVLAVVLGFGWLYYGDPLPNTYYLKATGAPRALVLASGIGQFTAMLTPASVPLWVFTAVALARWGARRGALLAAAGTSVGLVAYDVWVGGDWIFTLHSRFVVPGVALYLVLHAGAVRLALARFRPAARPAGTGAVALGAALAPRPVRVLLPAALREFWLLAPETVYRQENE
jgi:hypothetical protein